MIISHKYKFIFIKTVKTAGTSIEVFLSRICDSNDIITPIIPFEYDHVSRNYRGIFNPIPEILVSDKIITKLRSIKEAIFFEKFYNHIPAWRVKERIGYRQWNCYYKFCVERNPWEKTLSNYYMLKKRNKNNLSFNEYIKQGSLALNYPKYLDYNQQFPIVDKIIRYEHLERELTEVFEKLKIPFSGKLEIYAKKNNINLNHDYMYIFNNDLKEYKEIIRNIYQKEINLFNYDID